VTEFSDAELADGRRAVAALDSAQWDLGDLALRVAGPVPPRGAHDPNRERLASFAEAIGIAPKRLAGYRSVASAWSPEDRLPGAAWSLHRGLAGRADRVEALTGYLALCREEGAAPTRAGLQRHSAGAPGASPRSPSFTIPATIEEAAGRLTEIASDLDRLESARALVVAEWTEAWEEDGSSGPAG